MKKLRIAMLGHKRIPRQKLDTLKPALGAGAAPRAMGENLMSDDMKVKVDVLYLGTGLSSENMRGIKIDDKKVYKLREIKIRRRLYRRGI